MATERASFISCGACGRRFEWKESLVGKPFRCACGSVVLAPAKAQTGREQGDDYDLAEEAIEPMPVAAPKLDAPLKPPPGLTRVSGQAVRARLGTIPAPKKMVFDPAVMRAKREAELEEMTRWSLVRDIIIPVALMTVGLLLSFYDVKHDLPNPPGSIFSALLIVAGRAAGSVALMVCGIFVAVKSFEVCLVGPFETFIFKLAAIAIGPSALYGICSVAGGEMAGGALGALASVAAYAALFWFLMKLDWKDTAVCVTVTWILVSLVNYAVYRLEGGLPILGPL